MLAANSYVFPLSIAVPLQPAFVFISLLTRVHLFHTFIVWKIVVAFVGGTLIGVLLGINLFAILSEGRLAIFLGLLLLVLIWAPPLAIWRDKRVPFFPVGIVHGCIGTVFGVGAVLQPSILRTKLTREQITGTLAASLMAMDVLKALSYTFNGFQYQDYIVHIVLASIAGFLGTWVGKKLAGNIPEKRFRSIFRLIVSFVAVRLIIMGFIAY